MEVQTQAQAPALALLNAAEITLQAVALHHVSGQAAAAAETQTHQVVAAVHHGTKAAAEEDPPGATTAVGHLIQILHGTLEVVAIHPLLLIANKSKTTKK